MILDKRESDVEDSTAGFFDEMAIIMDPPALSRLETEMKSALPDKVQVLDRDHLVSRYEALCAENRQLIQRLQTARQSIQQLSCENHNKDQELRELHTRDGELTAEDKLPNTGDDILTASQGRLTATNKELTAEHKLLNTGHDMIVDKDEERTVEKATTTISCSATLFSPEIVMKTAASNEAKEELKKR